MPSETERFWAKVNKSEDHWLWTGAVQSNGYGTFHFQGHQHRAPRISFYLTHGHWPEPQVDHLCAIRLCIRPDHLEEVTAFQNMRRAFGGTDAHCKNGHPRFEGSSYKDGSCRECHRQTYTQSRQGKILENT
jgi:hypothetical protein